MNYMIGNIFSFNKIRINDRYFLDNLHGFKNIGTSYECIKNNIDMKLIKDYENNDPVGCLRYLLFNTKLYHNDSFLIKIFRNKQIVPHIFFSSYFVPQDNFLKLLYNGNNNRFGLIKDNIRLSTGFGITLP